MTHPAALCMAVAGGRAGGWPWLGLFPDPALSGRLSPASVSQRGSWCLRSRGAAAKPVPSWPPSAKASSPCSFAPLPAPVHSSFKLKYLSGLWSALSVGCGGGARPGMGEGRGGAGSCSLSQPFPEQDLRGHVVGLALAGSVGRPVLGALPSRPQRAPHATLGSMWACAPFPPVGPLRFLPSSPPLFGSRTPRPSPFSPLPPPLAAGTRGPFQSCSPPSLPSLGSLSCSSQPPCSAI